MINISARLNAGQCILYKKKSIKSITPPKYILSIALPIAPAEIKRSENLARLLLFNKAIINKVNPTIRANIVKKYLFNNPPLLKSPKLIPVFLTKVIFKKGNTPIFSNLFPVYFQWPIEYSLFIYAVD